MSDLLGILTKAVLEGDHVQVVKNVKKALESGVPAADILEKGLVPGVQALGERFKDGRVYLPDSNAPMRDLAL